MIMGNKKKVKKYAAYPPNWRKEIVPTIRERAGNKCECCGIANGLLGYRDRYGNFVDLSEYADTQSKFVYQNGERAKLWDMLPNGHILIRIILTTAHLDHDPHNWSVSYSRLKYLCQRCHLNNDRAHNIRKRKYGDYHRQSKLPFIL